jgi:hypothetical protein
MSTPGNSKKVRARPSKPKFAMTGIVAGVVAGMAFGGVVEMASKPSPIFMQIGGIVGLATGALVESVRYWWQAYIYRGWQKEANRMTTVR